MKIAHNSQMALAILAATVLTASHCTVGKYPPDEHNKVAKPFIADSAAHDPLGVLMSGATSIMTGQEFNMSEGMLEGGTETSLLSVLPDSGTEAIQQQLALADGLIGPFTAPPDSETGFDRSKLPPDLWTENGTLLNRAERIALRIRQDRVHENNPLAYVEQLGLLLYACLHLDFAPEGDRQSAIVQRLSQTTEYLQNARSSLRSSSEVRIEAARESAQGVIKLIRNDIANSVPSTIQPGLEAASDQAVAALENFIQSLGDLPATDDWRAGPDLFHAKLALDTGQPIGPIGTLIEDTMSDFEVAHKALVSAAEPINRRIYGGTRPRDDFRLVNDVLEVLEGENRARSNERMMDQMAQDTEEARTLCNEEEIAPVPEDLKLRVIETPEFMRVSVPLAGGFGPTAAENDHTALVWLTPAPPDASRAELRDRLTTNNIHQLKLLALRYGIPGYALIGALASDMEGQLKKLTHMVEPLPGFIDGWPIYITETTVGTAYTGDVDFIWRKYKLQTIGAALVDMQMHAQDMGPNDAVQFLTRRAYMESSAARALVRSLQVNPTDAASTYLGWLGWQKLRAHYQETTQDFSLASFHGKALQTGSMPLVEFSYAVTEAKGRLSLQTGEDPGGE